MLTYVYFGTNDLARAIRFYDATLTPLGMQRCVEIRGDVADGSFVELEGLAMGEHLRSIACPGQRGSEGLCPQPGILEVDRGVDLGGTLELCAELGTPLAMYGVWSRFDEIPVSPPGQCFELALDPNTLSLKRRAMSCYQSQLRAFGPLPEDGPVLFDGFLQPFSEPSEVLWKRA